MNLAGAKRSATSSTQSIRPPAFTSSQRGRRSSSIDRHQRLQLPTICKCRKSAAARPRPRSGWRASTRRRPTVRGNRIFSVLFDNLADERTELRATACNSIRICPTCKCNLSDGSSVNVTLHQQAVAGTFATATTDRRQRRRTRALQFTAKQAGSNLTGVTINFVERSVDHRRATKRSNYNATTKTLTFDIDQA